jgi:chromosome segregation ATPase
MARREQQTNVKQDPKYDLTSFKNEKTRLENEMISLGATNNRINKEIEEGNKEIKDKQDKIKQLDLNIEEGEIKYNNIVKEINEVNLSHAKFLSNLNDKKKEFEQYTTFFETTRSNNEIIMYGELVKYNNQIKDLQDKINILNKEVIDKQNINKSLNIDIGSKESSIKNLDEKLSNKENELIKIDSLILFKKDELKQFGDITDKLSKLNKEYNLVQYDIENSKKELENVKEEKQKVIVEIEAKKQELIEKQNSYDNAVLIAEDRIAKLKHQYDKAEAEKIINNNLK